MSTFETQLNDDGGSSIKKLDMYEEIDDDGQAE